MLSLLALSFAGSAPAGCFNGGVFIGGQTGYSYVMLKKLAKKDAIKKEDADKLFDALLLSLGKDASYTPLSLATAADKTTIDSLKDFDFNATTKIATVKVTSLDDLTSDATIAKLRACADLSSVEVKYVVKTDAEKTAFTGAALTAAMKKVSDALGKKEDFSKKLVATEAETKFTSNNGFAGVHAGYLGRVNDKFLVGGLVEGNWVFGKNLKIDGGEEQKDTSARFNANLFLRAMFNLTHNFMVGADLGASFQEIRTPKTDKDAKSTDKDSKWFWGPSARLVLGLALTDNLLATAFFGGTFPVEQDSFSKDKGVKAKYSNFNGGVGISYAFGG